MEGWGVGESKTILLNEGSNVECCKLAMRSVVIRVFTLSYQVDFNFRFEDLGLTVFRSDMTLAVDQALNMKGQLLHE